MTKPQNFNDGVAALPADTDWGGEVLERVRECYYVLETVRTVTHIQTVRSGLSSRGVGVLMGVRGC
jgi:hypothetical protein